MSWKIPALFGIYDTNGVGARAAAEDKKAG